MFLIWYQSGLISLCLVLVSLLEYGVHMPQRHDYTAKYIPTIEVEKYRSNKPNYLSLVHQTHVHILIQ